MPVSKEKKLIVPDEVAMNKIYLIRGYKVMLDLDLAALYGVETKHQKRVVSRNGVRSKETNPPSLHGHQSGSAVAKPNRN